MEIFIATISLVSLAIISYAGMEINKQGRELLYRKGAAWMLSCADGHKTRKESYARNMKALEQL
jgi:hypothetical protein